MKFSTVIFLILSLLVAALFVSRARGEATHLDSDFTTTMVPAGKSHDDAYSQDILSLEKNRISTDKSEKTPSATIECYGTFHSMGIIITLGADDDPDRDATAAVTYRKEGNAYRRGFPLTRLLRVEDGDDLELFVGSLFWLEPGTTHDVRVTIADQDGDPIDGVTLATSGSTREEISIPAPDNSYYVSTTGDDGDDGTIEHPFASVAHALQIAQPGEEIVIRDGIYFEGELSIPTSGTEGAPIVIRGYPGETAVLDGSDPETFVWTDLGGGIYRTYVNVANPNLIAADGERLLPYNSLADLENLVWGIPGFYTDGTTAYVRLAGDADPNESEMSISRYNYMFYVDKDYIYFTNLTIRYYGGGEWAKAILIQEGSNNLIERCTFAVNDVAIGLKYGSNRNVIQNNEIYDTVFEWPWDAFYSGVELGWGMYFYEPCTGRGNIIRRNTFHDLFDGLCVCPAWTADITNETDVYRNLVYRCGDDGMETDGRCSNVRIWGNTFHDFLTGISLAPVYTGPVYVMRNLLYRAGTGVHPEAYAGSAFKFNSGGNTDGRIFLFHNTAHSALEGNFALEIKWAELWPGVHARNNIWVGTFDPQGDSEHRGYAFQNWRTDQILDFNYNDYWTEGDNGLIGWNWTVYDSIGEFFDTTGLEENGLGVYPSFRSIQGADYRLDAESGLIDAGLIIPGINNCGNHIMAPYSGDWPDMGCFEFRGGLHPTDIAVTDSIP